VSPKGDRIVFTSMRDGDLDLYTMNIDGSDVKRVTTSWATMAARSSAPTAASSLWRASRPKTPEDGRNTQDLLKEGLVMPTNMELYVANVDGSDAKQITELGQANWAPLLAPRRQASIIFASNHNTERGFPFTLYLINRHGRHRDGLGAATVVTTSDRSGSSTPSRCSDANGPYG
jgi:TolB protein